MKMVMPCNSTKENQQEKNGQNGHCPFEDLDHSILQQPLNLGVNNIKQVLKCVQSGTKEVKDLILNECNVIYECKACVSLFRSIANFMYHKRCYCKKHFCEEMVLFDGVQDDTIVIQPEAPDEDKIEKATDEKVEEDKVEKATKRKMKTKIYNLPQIQECSVSMVRANLTKDLMDNVQEKHAISEINENDDLMEAKTPESLEKFEDMLLDTSDDLIIVDDEPNSLSRRNSTDTTVKNTKIPAPTPGLIAAEPKVNPMVSRRTRDKNNRETFSSVVAKKTLEKSMSSQEPVLLKLIPKNTSKNPRYTAHLKKPFSFVTKNDEKLGKAKGISGKQTSYPTITLKTIKDNPHAVYQASEKKSFVTKATKTSSDSNKTENEKIIIVVAKKDVKNSTDESSEKFSAERKKSKVDNANEQNEFHMTRRKRLMGRSDCNVHELKCLVCNTQFMSLKTLFFHMMSLHSKKRQYYPCPFCKTLFVQIYGVTRHLRSIHKKTKEQISKLKETIKKKAVWRRVDDMIVDLEKSEPSSPFKEVEKKKPSIEMKTPSYVEFRKEETVKTGSPANPDSQVHNSKKLILHKCSKCQRVFGRKSSQVSHEKFCIMNAIKLEVIEKPATEVSQVIEKKIAPPQISPSIISVIPVSPPKNLNSDKHLMDLMPDMKISMRPKRGAEKQMHKDFVNSQTLKWRSANKVDTNKIIPLSKKGTGKNVEKRVMNIINMEDLSCLKCDRKFSSFSNLRRHAAIHVGWTRFQCKFCEYQAYNKSQCWSHIQKTHSIEESEVNKCIVSLVCSGMSTKQPVSSTAAKSSQSLKTSATNIKTIGKDSSTGHKVKISKLKSSGTPKYVTLQKKVLSDAKQDKGTTSNETPKYVILQKKVSSETKRDKGMRPSPVRKFSLPIYKKEVSNYKSVTTNNPTTIILSKKDVTIHPPPRVVPTSPIMSSTILEKISPTRTSPRKSDQKIFDDENTLTSLVTRSSAYKKDIVIPIRFSPKQSTIEEIKKDITSEPDKPNVKKDRLISEWFPKKDMVGITKRDSAPLIIGLVPAVNTGLGVGVRVKNSVVPNDRSNS